MLLNINVFSQVRYDSGAHSSHTRCCFFPHYFICSTSFHQWGILKALLLLKDPAEGGTCDNRGDSVRKWLFKSVHQLICLPNEESCCYWWQQNYFSVISGRDICRSKLIVQMHFIYTDLTFSNWGSLTRWTNIVIKVLPRLFVTKYFFTW